VIVTEDATMNRFTRHEKIDVCRGLFAALVVLAHALQIAWVVHPGVDARMPEMLREALDALFRTGTIYVMGFFVVSGYCIQLSVARQLDAGQFSVGQYIAARLSRILPLYYLGLLLALIVEWAIADARPVTWPHGVEPGVILAQVCLVQNLSQTYGSFAPSWSITNEIFYYVFYGVLAYAFLARPRRAVWVGMAIATAVLGITQAHHFVRGYTPLVYGLGQLFGLGLIWFLGVLVAIYGDALVRFPLVRLVARCWPAGIAAVMLWKFFHQTPHGFYLISGLTFTLLMIRFHIDDDPEARVRRSDFRAKLAAGLGLTSYPMYLFHGPLMMLTGSWIMRSGVVTDWRITWFILTAVGLTCGVLGAWLLERPVMAWRAAFLRRLREASVGRRPAVSAIGQTLLGRMPQ
jgi:peptidoglycan/LPS O-acetylase OafA/YrhL